MSRLEKLIKRAREIWEKNNIDPNLIDEMIDSMATAKVLREDIAVETLTEEQIMNATSLYVDMKQKLEEEKRLWQKPQT